MNRSKLIIILSLAILCIVTVLCVMLLMIFPTLGESTNRLIFTSDSLESYYDGNALKGESWSMVSGKLKEGHEAEVTLVGSQRYVGTSQNLMQIIIVDSNGSDVTSEYEIECVPGTLTVKPVNLTITSSTKTKIYDGEPLEDDGYTVVPLYNVPPLHKLTVEVTGSITEIGETGNTISRVVIHDSTGKDVTFNFNIVVIEGKLIVTDENGLDWGDLNIDLDGDMLPDLNIDLDGDMLPDLDIDLNGDMLADLNIDLDGDMLADLDIDLDGDMLADLNIDLDGDMLPDLNTDLNGDMLPDINIDLDGDMLPDLNTDLNGDLIPDVDIDLNGDGKPDLNVGGSGMLDVSGNIGAGALGDLAPGLAAIVCYKVTADNSGRIYLKIANFGSYSGQSWGSAKQYDELVYSYGSAEYLPGLAMLNSGKELSWVSVEILNGQGVMPYYSYIYGSYPVNTSDVKVEYGDRTVNFLFCNEGYDGAVLPDDLVWYEEKYRAFVYENYLDIDAESYEYMLMIAEANGFSRENPNVIKAVASYIQNAAKYDLFYDRSLDEEENIAIKFLDEYQSGICQHYASAATLLYRSLGIPARYTVGFACDAVGGETVEVTAMQAHAWVEVYVDGIGWIAVEVTGGMGGSGGDTQEKPNKIVVFPATCEKQYDGLPLVAENKLQVTSEIAEWTKMGYTFVPTVSGERTEPGKSKSVITDLRIYDPAGEDVTDQFEIDRRDGVVHVYTVELRFESESIEKEYDGVALMADVSGVAFIEGDLPMHHTWVSTPSDNAIIDVGSVQNSFDIKIYNEYGEDVTDIYKIVKRYGSLEINPRSITVTAGSATASYTGEPLVCGDIFITNGWLVEGDYIFDYVVEGSQTDRGRSDNIVKSITIYDSKGRDVTKNYAIVLEKGTLKVTN